MRDLQAKKAAAAAYWASRRPRRAKILQVPAVGSTPEQQTMRPVLVPAPLKPISWAQAREIGRAYVRVLEGLPAHPEAHERAELARLAARETTRRQVRAKLRREGKLPAKVRRDPRGEWWMNKFADLVERRRASEEH